MRSYMSLLVLVLATSAVSPVRAFDPLYVAFVLGAESNLPDVASGREIEGTSHSEPSERPRFKITPGKVVAGLGTLAVVGIIVANLVGGPPSHFKNNNTTNTTQPNSTTQPPAPPPTSPPQPTPITPPRAFNGREVRILNRHGLSVDTSSESCPKSYQDGIADGVVTTAGHSETRSISDNNNQEM
jgi:hypothetical protein